MKAVYAPDTMSSILDAVHTYAAATPLVMIFGAVVTAIFATLTKDWF